MRTCCSCGRSKPLTEFAFRSKEKGTRHTKCKTCAATYSKEYFSVRKEQRDQYQKKYYIRKREELLKDKRTYYERNREKMKQVNAANYQRHKDRAQKYARDKYRQNPTARKQYAKDRGKAVKHATFEAYGGAFCACCGEANEMFLSIDHINGCSDARRRQEGRGTAFYGWLKKRGYPKMDLRVLCFNCNLGRKVNGGVCPHVDASKRI